MVSNLLKYFSNLPRINKAFILIITDLFIMSFSLLMAFAVRFDPGSLLKQFNIFIIGIFLMISLQLIALALSGLYRSVLRHAGSELFFILLRSFLLGAGFFSILVFLITEIRMPRSIIVMTTSFSFLSLLSTRLMIRWFYRLHLGVQYRDKKLQKVVIYGAGYAGMQLFDSLSQDGTYKILAFVDDNPKLHGGKVREKLILSFDGLKKLHIKNQLDWVLLAISNVKNEKRKKIIQKILPLKIGVRVLPTINQLMEETSDSSQLQEVGASDLLGRDEIKPYPDLIKKNIEGKNVLVTGAGGSIGCELFKEILCNSPKTLILLELNELALYKTEFLIEESKNESIISCLGSVSDRELVKTLLKKHKIQTVYHAAAYKHVPLIEKNPLEGLKNNIFGTKSLVENCIDSQVELFVLISTDKAVRPTSVMGVSKRIAEMIVQDKSRKHPKIKFGIVRFGNVLDSSGSVVPIFRNQIRKRQPITVTHPEMTRYFMSIGEAVRLVIQAGSMSNIGEVFLLEMGTPVKIKDLAFQMIELSGLIPEKDIPIKYTGLRPGEKLFEELLINPEQSQPTDHPRIFSSNEPLPDSKVIEKEINNLSEAISNYDLPNIFKSIKKLVPEYITDNSQKF